MNGRRFNAPLALGISLLLTASVFAVLGLAVLVGCERSAPKIGNEKDAAKALRKTFNGM